MENKLVEKLADDLKKYSPVLITGAPGVGKSYMLGYLLNKLKDATTLLTGEEIFNSLMNAIKQSGKEKWRENLNEQKLLFIDDIDYLQHKLTTQEYLLSVFKKYDKPVVATSEKPLDDAGFLGAFVSYFDEGAHIHLNTPTPAAQEEFLQKCIVENSLEFTAKASEWLFARHFDNYSKIIGIVKSLCLHCNPGERVTVNMCRKIWKWNE